MKMFGGKSRESEITTSKWMIPIGGFALIFFIIGASRRPEMLAIPVIMILMSPFWIWMRNKHELKLQSLKTVTPEEKEKSSRTEERIANLEALICRLDTE